MNDERFFSLFYPRREGESVLAWHVRREREWREELTAHDPPINPDEGCCAVHLAPAVQDETGPAGRGPVGG